MADNSTHPILEILQSFGLRDLVLAFCLSMVVGLVLGALVYVTLTWMSRRRASATITRLPSSRCAGRSSSSSSSSPRSRANYERRSNNSLASAAFSFHRQAACSSPNSEQADLLGRKSSFRASTFHPLLQCSQIAREAEEGSQSSLPRTPPLTFTNHPAATGSTVTVSSTVTPPRARPDSFWGNNGLRGVQTPPPAYDSIIRAYQETCT
ncbi:myc target protein 1 homolog [Hoplias malabaricus]|uniref:myc target protein 1 homolog n=1 Tax=Hoplias malabaricus TaxID=27720 RepID=UPI00346231E5